jgi:hypothetical protein
MIALNVPTVILMLTLHTKLLQPTRTLQLARNLAAF